MSKLAHSNDETMEAIELAARERDGTLPDGYCPKCEVYAPYPGGDAKHSCGTVMTVTP